ncbi:hypothetical protein QBZ16_005382 [Prototheca wickerhamii]|uniref:amino-acid N-acetyltransferase n=1 Tax=Prototheca wickerhamii TaxID=3111 RepID=A0AAD9MHC7_PROWI|nr:hypothetical protein QBZ16_005382 [Prototheca wickerhamii]
MRRSSPGKQTGLDRLDQSITSVPPASGDQAELDSLHLLRCLHVASPYVVRHRGRTFVVVVPGEVAYVEALLRPLLEDLLLLHGLGVRLVVVVGGRPWIDAQLAAAGRPPRFEGAYRVTDEASMAAALHASSAAFIAVAGALSHGPSVQVERRHAARGAEAHIVNGNFTVARRRGIVDGVDFGLMGQVRYVRREAVAAQLDGGAIVVLTNLGVSSSGDLLNCNVYDVATHAAVGLQADKLICLCGPEVSALGLPAYLPLDDAEALIAEAATGSGAGGTYSFFQGGRDDDDGGLRLDLDSWQQVGYPREVVAAAVACRNGVLRAHLVDVGAAAQGALLIELYTRDGTRGVTMIAADLYEGIRPAGWRDVAGVTALLTHLQDADGVPVPGWLPDVSRRLGSITVLEREGKLLACACLADLGVAPDGARVAELAALVVHPAYRRNGLGDSLLDFVEQDARRAGFGRCLVVQAGPGAYDWFLERGYEGAGPARDSPLLPRVVRNSLPAVAHLYHKRLLELDAEDDVPAGHRIGF